MYCCTKLSMDVRHCTIDSLIAICKIDVPSLLVALRRCLKRPLLHMHKGTASSEELCYV